MSNLKYKIEDFLLEAQAMLENSLSDPTVKAALAGFGYGEEKLLAGKKLYETAVELHNKQKKEYGEQLAASTEMESAWEAADQQYIRALKVARIVLKEHGNTSRSIELYGSRKQSISGWIDQTKAFYTNILGDAAMLQSMAEYGYSQDKLQAGAALVDQMAAKHFQQMKESGEAQKATDARDLALDELAKFISDLRAMAKVALDEDPQQLEKIGILARSRK